jgi:hypothetical protein
MQAFYINAAIILDFTVKSLPGEPLLKDKESFIQFLEKNVAINHQFELVLDVIFHFNLII